MLFRSERMRINSGNWWNLEPAAKSGDAQAQLAQKKLHEENIALGRAVFGEFNPIDGKWYRNGKSLYDLPESQREYVSYDIVQPPNPYPVKKPENAPILNSSHDVLNALGITTPQNGTGITETYYKPLINEKEIVKNGGSVTNSNISTNSNNSYVINGVPIDTGMAETYTIRELLEVMPIVQNQF